jgi:hypothetical protein
MLIACPFVGWEKCAQYVKFDRYGTQTRVGLYAWVETHCISI